MYEGVMGTPEKAEGKRKKRAKNRNRKVLSRQWGEKSREKNVGGEDFGKRFVRLGERRKIG